MKNRLGLLSFTCAALAASANSNRASAQIAREDTLLADPPGIALTLLGRSVALQGDEAVVGASNAVGLPGAGAVAVYERQAAGGWIATQQLVPPFLFAGGGFGRVVAFDGDTVAVSQVLFGDVAIWERAPGGPFSHVHTFTFAANNAPAVGRTLALDDGRIAVPKSGHPLLGQKGTVLLFERGATAWASAGSIVVSDVTDELFGTALALEGNRLVVGSPGDDRDATNGGVVHVFERSAGVWTRTAVLAPPSALGGERFGTALALDGDRLAVGAPSEGGSATGAVHVFERDASGIWLLAATLVGSAQAGDFLGSDVALAGDDLVAGAPGSDVDEPGAGALVHWRRDGAGVWHESARLVHTSAATLDELGATRGGALALDAGRVMAGAQKHAAFEGLVAQWSLGTLLHGANELSLASGGAHDLIVRGGSDAAGDLYFVLGSLSGTSPGVALAPGVTLPLVPDVYTDLCLAVAAPIAPAFGLLDAQGAANAAFALPAGAHPALAGLVLHHAVLSIDLTTFQVGATNAVRLELVP
jgi:hypothetical protein